MSSKSVQVASVSILTILLILVIVNLSFKAQPDSHLNILEFDVEFTSNIDHKPVFSWKTAVNGSNSSQAQVQILIADNKASIDGNKGNIWDSGKMGAMAFNQLKYPNNDLKNGNQYFAKIRLWDADKKVSFWSEAKSFFIPIAYPQNWSAEWITYNYNRDEALPIFKKKITIGNPKDIESVRLYIAAPGFYEAFLNGEKIGKNVLDPGQTNYEDYTYYSAYTIDINRLKSKNALSVLLGNGWYNQNVVWGKGLIYGQPVFIAQLVIRYNNGKQRVIGTDESWEWIHGPITFSNIYAGETYNAPLNPKDWDTFSNISDAWQKATIAEKHPTQLLEQFAEPIQVLDSLSIKGIIAKDKGRYILDFGQNFTGWLKLKVKGDKGQEIILKCVEELDEKGEIDPRTTGIRATKVIQTQKYICSGEGTEIWEPKFTYLGFRYVEVSGLNERPSNDFVKGMIVYSAMEKSGEFSCSEENINKLHQLADWTIKGNIQGIPTDCPHREKCGWTGDAHALTHALFYNYNAQRFMSKYMFDMRSSARKTNKELYFGKTFQDRSIIDKPKGIPTMIVPGKRTSGVASPDWGTAMAQIPWYLYLYYGDLQILENFYPDMKVWVDYIQAKNEYGIITHGLGDWCPPGGNSTIECPVPVSSTAFHILDLSILAKAAKVLGISDDAEYYGELHKETVNAFNAQFLDKKKESYGSQTANAMALEIGIVPSAYKEKVAKAIVKDIHENHNGFLSTGIFGIARIFKALAENGCEEELYRLLTKKGEHSFANMWESHDATTLWEVLPFSNSHYDDMAYRSHSHPMQASFDAWFYAGIAGISLTEQSPAFKKIVFKPYLTQYIKNAQASYESSYGKVSSKWENKDGVFLWEVVIPYNAEGEILLPTYSQKVSITINGKLENRLNYSNKFTSLGSFSSGTYQIEMQKKD